MEQKRLLWIIAAVGVFLLVVLGAALIIYAPASKTPQSIASITKNNNKAAANGWISLAPAAESNSSGQTSLEPPHAEEFNYAQNGFEMPKPLDLEGEQKLSSPEFASGTNTEKSDNEIKINEITVHAEKATVIADNVITKPVSTTIDLNVTSAAKTAQNTTLPKTNTSVQAKDNVKKVEAPKSTSVAYESKKTPAANTAKKAAAPKKPEIIQYWIQVTALTSRKSADSAREELAKNQINADVFTYTNNKNQLFYRVRVGPYTTKTEAEYWRNKISQIDNFAKSASYVTTTKTEQL